MKRALMLAAFLFLVFAFSTTASANLIQYGDFSGTTIKGPEFTIGSPTQGATGEWYALSPWTISSGGPSGSVFYFDHSVVGDGGGDQRAFQPVDTSAMSLTGQEITLSFNYIFEPGTFISQGMGVALVGLSGDGARYNAYGGLGYDGYDAGWYGPDLATARTVLGTLSLAQTSGWWANSLTLTVDQNYDVILAVFAASTWNNKVLASDEGLRGIATVSLTAPVPEPATLLLLGSGLLGLAGLRRRLLK